MAEPITNAMNEQITTLSAPNLSLSDEETRLLGKLNEWFSEATKYIQPRRERWRKNEQLYLNKVEVFGRKGWTELKFNLALAIIRTEMAIISDYLPTFDIIGEEENDRFFANMLQKRKAQIERSAQLVDKILDTIHDGLNYSNGLCEIQPVIQTITNPDGTSFKKLTIQARLVDPFTWLPAPYSTGMDIRTECLYQMFATPVHIDIIKRTYGVEVPAEGYLDENRAFHLVEDPQNQPLNSKYALVKECYFMDEDLDKYPNGRAVVWVGNRILEDKPIGIAVNGIIKPEEFSLLPYFMIGNYKTAHSIFGIGEGELVKSQIKAFNQVMSSLADNIKKQGNPIRKIRKHLARQLESAILGVAGEEIEVIEPDDITWDVPPNVPSHTWNFLEWLLRLTDTITGVHDVTQGRRPLGITAGIAIAELQEAAQTAVRYKIKKYINPFIISMGRYITYLLQNLDEEVKEIRDYTATEPAYTLYDPLSRYDKYGRREGEEGFDETTAKTIRDAKFEVEVVTGIRLPSGRFEDEARRIEKFKAGIYGIEDVTIYEQNRDEIISRYYQRMGLAQLKERQEALNEAYNQFTQLISKSLSTEKQWIGSPEEETMARLLKQFPELLNTEDFANLPLKYKNNLLEVFKIGA